MIVPRNGKLPRIVYQMCVNGALIAGSYAKWLAGDKTIEPNDFDLVVPPEYWHIIALLIPSDASLNKFGGWRFEVDGTEIDVWPGTMQDYLTRCKTKHGGEVVLVDFINNKVFAQRTLLETE